MSRLTLAVAVAVVALGVTTAGLAAAGWHVTVQMTPSMLGVVPVGALVLLAPASWSALHAGELVGVRPGPGPAVVHWVARISPTSLRTHNALSTAPDAWVLHPGRHELVGRAVAVIPGLGWVVSSWPILTCLVVGLVLAVVARRWWRMAGGLGGIYMAGLLWMAGHHPLASVRVVGQVSGRHSATLVAVSTALAPMRVRLTGASARTVRVAPGGLIRLTGHVSHLPAHLGWVAATDLAAWWQALVWAGIAAPAAGGLTVLVVCLARDVRIRPGGRQAPPQSERAETTEEVACDR